MKLLFIACCLVIIVQLSYRRFDFFSIAAISYMLYFSSCLIGRVWIPGSGRMLYETNISEKTYIMIISQLYVINIILFASNNKIVLNSNRMRGCSNKYKRNARESQNVEMFWELLLWGCVLIFLYNIFFRIGLDSFFSYTAKGELSSRVGTLYSLAIWAAILCFVEGALHHKKWRFFSSGILILITVLIGSRAYLATALAAFFVIKAGKIKNVLKANIRIAFWGGSAIIILMLYKNIYSEIRALDFSEAINRLRNLSSIVDVSEFRIINAVYNYVTESDFRFPFNDIAVRILSGIPFLNDYIPSIYPLRFSETIQHEFFSATYGLGGNFWAETYAMGGYLFLLAVTFIWGICIEKATKIMVRQDSVFLIVVVAYCSFYIHRLDWIQVWGCVKSVLVIYICYLVWTKSNIALKCNEYNYIRSMQSD